MVGGARQGGGTGHKWVAAREVEEMESRLRHKDIVGYSQSGRAGLGIHSPPKETQHLVQEPQRPQLRVRDPMGPCKRSLTGVVFPILSHRSILTSLWFRNQRELRLDL